MHSIPPALNLFLAGIFFGIWPLILNRSGLSGIHSSMVFSTCAALFIIGFGLLTSNFTIVGANWTLVLMASCFGGIGLIFMNNGLALATPQQVGKLFLIMVLTQITIPAVYHAVVNGGLDLRTGLGIAAAVVAASLLA